MNDFLRDFLNDTKEDLDKIESNLVGLEKLIDVGDEIDYDIVNTIFRHFHSIKGSAGFFELKEIVRVAHQAENILDLFRKHLLDIEADYLDVIYRVHDFIGELVENTGKNGHDRGLESRADSLLGEMKKVEAHRKDNKQTEEKPVADHPEVAVGNIEEDAEIQVESDTGEEPLLIFNEELNEETANDPEDILFMAENSSDIVAEQTAVNEIIDDSSSIEPVAEEETEDLIQAAEGELQESKPPEEPEATKWGLYDQEKNQVTTAKETEAGKLPSIEIRDIRIGTDKLDAMMDLLGELVIVEAMVTRHANDEILNVEMLRRATSQLGKVTRYLQEIGLSMRMVPVSGLFQKMTRLVRDLSRKSEKHVKFEVRGEETEIDKTIIEMLSDPLVHIIRNALDHGMETAGEREKIGKPPVGQISMEAMHRGSEIWIVIKDDGRGLNREKILKKAIENGLIETDGSDMTDSQVWELIFQPGFSTADTITDISGRGVGLDVVRRNISRLKGKIDVHSVSGEGSSFYLRIPLTLAIIDAMVVQYSGRYYIFPTENIERFIDLTAMQVSEIHDHQKLVRIGRQLISLVDLNEIFSYSSHEKTHNERIAVVIGKEGDFVAILLDAIIGSQQVVVKPLDESMEHLHGLSGSAILGDGEVGLIIDTEYIVQLYINTGDEQQSETSTRESVLVSDGEV